MSKVHILGVSELRHEADLVFHIPTSAGNNVAGIAYSAALQQFATTKNMLGEVSGPVSQIVGLATSDPTDDAGIKAGTVYEHREKIEFNANLTNAQKTTLIDQLYQSRLSQIQTKITNQLSFWGMTRSPA